MANSPSPSPAWSRSSPSRSKSVHRTGNRKDSWEEWEWEDGGWERRSWQNKPWWEKGDSREREDWGAGKPGESTTSGSYRERQRLHHIQAKHGQPRNQEELDLQRLSAMGQSRFKRLADRKERRAKEEAAKQEAFQAGANWQFQLQQLQQMQQWQAHQWQAQQWQAQQWGSMWEHPHPQGWYKIT